MAYLWYNQGNIMSKTRQQKLKAIDLFAGIGGMRMGFEKAGFDIVYSNDFDKNACKTYRENFGEIDERDIKDIDPDKIPDFDVLLGGFPCQPFSMIGKRKGMDDERAKSFFHIIRILNAKQPSAFVLENVKHLRLYDKGRVYERIKNNLEWAGYTVQEAVLDSKRFGVPQHRERLYIVGFLNPNVKFKFPKPRRELIPLSTILEKNIGENYYLSEKYYTGLLKHKKRHAKGGNGFGCAILNTDGVSNTLVAGNMGRERNLIQDIPVKKNKWGIRKLTVKECARLQGFPERYKFPVSITRSYQQLGNAVTVNVANTVAKKVKEALLKTLSPKTLPSTNSAFSQLTSCQLQEAATAHNSFISRNI